MAVVEKTLTTVVKRDGRTVSFDKSKIKEAVSKAMEASGEVGDDIDTHSNLVADHVTEKLDHDVKFADITIEHVQDIVEETLILDEYAATAKAYILYRNKRAEERAKSVEIPEHVKDLVSQSKEFFPNPLGEFVFYRSYSRWIDEEGRRETWVETVDRYTQFMKDNLGDKLSNAEYAEINRAILTMEVMPSMRLMWSAGKAAKEQNACGYNCSYVAPSKIEDFAEILYLLMCGCGVGFTVESHVIQKLPMVEYQLEDQEEIAPYVVGDSKVGWAQALTHGLKSWFLGKDVTFDYSGLRPRGAKLKTMGGRSAGPEPLIALMQFARAKILSRQGRRLSNLDVHDIICKIGEIVVMGGVRRSSLISLSDLDDVDMRDAKNGHFFLSNGQRSLANNSVAYMVKPTHKEFMREFLALAESGSGERGIFNRASLRRQIPSRRLRTFEDGFAESGTNPCGEIVLKSKQFCNLTEVVARADDTQKTIKRKIRIASILGTYQSMLTDFPFLSDEWKENCESERLLGISITGQWDSPTVREVDTLRWAKAIATDTNKEYAERFGISPSVSITCVKPSGTVSQLVDAASGMHPRHAPYYVRRIRISATDPLFAMMREQGFPFHPEVGQELDSASTFVLEFPVKAPQGAIFKNDLTAIQQLEYWKQVKEHFTEHNPSCTISVGEDEWLDTAIWVYKNWEIIGGLSFLPREDHVYQLAPYEEITKEEYERRLGEMPDIDFSMIMAYEKDDQTEGSKEAACIGDKCEV
jgi:ribonucleoside-triphosphate reductase